MPNTVRYVNYHDGDNAWLLDTPKDTELEDWNEAWGLLRGGCKHHIEITEDIYNNQEYGDIPKWIDITIQDEGILPFKTATTISNSLDGCEFIRMGKFFSVDISDEWGNSSHEHMLISKTNGVYVEISAKHSQETVEVNITKQFNKAIGV